VSGGGCGTNRGRRRRRKRKKKNGGGLGGWRVVSGLIVIDNVLKCILVL
jgi:hypothetical protein